MHIIFQWKPEGKRRLDTLKLGWKINIKRDIKAISMKARRKETTGKTKT
jgi:hypothetical protein